MGTQPLNQREQTVIKRIVAAVIAIIAISGIGGLISSNLHAVSGGEVAVVRNGGPLDNRNVRQEIDPGSGLTWTGWGSETHTYPAQQRFYTITADGKRGERVGVDVVTVPTSDGVNLGVEGTVYFTLNTDHATLKQFDDKFGTRKFTGLDGNARHAWDGDKGWSTFLDQIVRPVIENDLRAEIGGVRCAELVSSCSLVQNAATPTKVDAPAPITGAANITRVQQAVNTSLAADIEQTLGGKFLTGIHFNLSRVTLPGSVQKAVDDAQAAYAAVTQAQAKVAQAKAEADANRARQQGYNSCPVCGQIDLMRAIPPNVSTYAPGAGVTVPTK